MKNRTKSLGVKIFRQEHLSLIKRFFACIIKTESSLPVKEVDFGSIFEHLGILTIHILNEIDVI